MILDNDRRRTVKVSVNVYVTGLNKKRKKVEILELLMSYST